MNDAKKIRTIGLWLRNCENNNLHFLKDFNWKLPFSLSGLKNEIGKDSKVRAYIGFETTDKKIIQYCIDILNNLGGIDCRYKNGILEIINTSPVNKERKENWKAIYSILEELI